MMRKVCVLGLGYIGLPTAAMLATHGYQVIGVDINDRILATLQNGGIHIQEPGLKALARQAMESGNLTVQNRLELADAFIIAVPTPFLEHTDLDGYKRADISYVMAATQSVAPYLRPGCLVVLESTSPPRTTTDLVRPLLEQSGLQAGRDFHLVYSPERVLPGQILRELVENARVIGGVTPECAQMGRDLYASFVKGEIVLTDATTAEMVKLMENTTRDVNIALANEFSRLAHRFQINVWEAIQIANLHPRVKILNPGPGVGGHCISVDPWFLVEAAPDITPLIHTARQVNDRQPEFVVGLVADACGGSVADRSILLLGVTYKPDVDDVRESPALQVIRLLKQKGAVVEYHDPYIPRLDHDGWQLESAPDLLGAARRADCVVIVTNHSSYDYPAILENAQLIVDTRNMVNATGNGSPKVSRL